MDPCYFCGRRLSDGDKRCPECGKSVSYNAGHAAVLLLLLAFVAFLLWAFYKSWTGSVGR
jgi:predicted amidophosphoribosyltransferase